MHFRPALRSHVAGGEAHGDRAVLLGSRTPLRANQRRRLRRSLAKALYGAAFEQNFQRTRNGTLKSTPIGVRHQYIAFTAPGRLAAKSLAW